MSTMKKKPGDLDILGGDHSLLSVGVSIWSLACMWSNTTSLNAKKKQVTRPLKGVVEYTTIKNTSLDEEGCDVVIGRHTSGKPEADETISANG